MDEEARLVDEEARFETRAVLAPRRARVARVALLVPVIAFVAIAWAGLNGPDSDPTTAVRPTTAVAPGPTTAVVPSLPVAYPAQVIGLEVQPLGELQIGGLHLDSVVAIAGWYVPTAIDDCPKLAAIYRDGAPPNVRGDVDSWAYCVRSGLLYPFRPDFPNDRPLDALSPAIAVTVIKGVVMPLQLETVGNEPTAVVVVGHFGKIGDGCRSGVGCSRELLVDHLAWTPDA